MISWALVLLLWNAKGTNDMTTVPGFTSIEACQEAGRVWAKEANGATVSPYTYCVRVR